MAVATESGKKNIGVLALQGDVREHLRSIASCGATPTTVKTAEDLVGLDGLVLPGGESTAMAVLLEHDSAMLQGLRDFVRTRPTWGTCAGLVMLADRLTETSAKRGGQTLLGGLQVCVDRNHYGNQCQSFEAPIDITDPALQPAPDSAAAGTPASVVLYPFIRAPGIAAIDGAHVVVLGRVAGTPVAVRQGHLMATAFHPELVAARDGAVWLRYFLDRVVSSASP